MSEHGATRGAGADRRVMCVLCSELVAVNPTGLLRVHPNTGRTRCGGSRTPAAEQPLRYKDLVRNVAGLYGWGYDAQEIARLLRIPPHWASALLAYASTTGAPGS